MRTAYDLRNKEKRMKRKFWPAAMTALMALLLTCGFAACADTGDTGNDNPNDNPDTPEESLQATEGLVFTLSQDGTEYFVTDYTGTAAEVYVPATHEGLPVTTIRHYGDGDAFAYCKQLTSVTLPDSITSIGGGAFLACSQLTSVKLPDSLVSIGEDAFDGCTELTSVTFENPEGWYVSEDAEAGTRIASSDLSDPATAARYLTDMYYYCYHNWIRLS